MPHGHLSFLQTFSQRLVKSQEKEIPWFSVSGTAFAFQLVEITFLQGGIAIGNQNSKCLSQPIALAFLGGAVAGVVAGFLLAPGSEKKRAGFGKAMLESSRKKSWSR